MRTDTHAASLSLAPDREAVRAFGDLLETLAITQADWTGSDVSTVRIEHATMDLMHHVCMALPSLSPVERASPGDRILAREAYLSTITVAAIASGISVSEPMTEAALTAVHAKACALLDALEPYVSRSDRAVRAKTLDAASLPTCPPHRAPTRESHTRFDP